MADGGSPFSSLSCLSSKVLSLGRDIQKLGVTEEVELSPETLQFLLYMREDPDPSPNSTLKSSWLAPFQL